jgi:hypothetical protein
MQASEAGVGLGDAMTGESDTGLPETGIAVTGTNVIGLPLAGGTVTGETVGEDGTMSMGGEATGVPVKGGPINGMGLIGGTGEKEPDLHWSAKQPQTVLASVVHEAQHCPIALWHATSSSSHVLTESEGGLVSQLMHSVFVRKQPTSARSGSSHGPGPEVGLEGTLPGGLTGAETAQSVLQVMPAWPQMQSRKA